MPNTTQQDGALTLFNTGKNGFKILTAGAHLACAMVICVFTLFTAATDANAQSRAQVCRGLKNQLNSLGNSRATGGNSAKYRQFDSAVRKQNNQINRANRALRRNGCIGILRNSRSQCRAIGRSLRKMQDNLVSLKRQRATFAPRNANTAQRRDRILASLRRNRCNTVETNEIRQASREQQPKSRRRTLLEQVFGLRAYDDRGNFRYDQSQDGDASLADQFGTFRTLCVRKTDGYYFPISFSTVPERFEADAQACQAMCPGSDVALYHHRMPSEDSEDMVSFANNTPYKDEPFAFAYRKEHNPNYRCRFSTAGLDQSVDAQPVGDLEPARTVIRVGVPVFRKDPSLSPDAFDTLVEDLNADRVRDYIVSLENKDEPSNSQFVAGSRNVRIVGPAFFPVQ